MILVFQFDEVYLSIPYLIVLVVELVAERLAHETILVEGEQLIVGIILHVIANRRWQVGGCDWATSHQLQGNYRLLLCIRIECIEANEVTIENHLVATADIAGIGPVTRDRLIKAFKSVKRIQEASIEDIEKVVGAAKATKIKEASGVFG